MVIFTARTANSPPKMAITSTKIFGAFLYHIVE